MNKAFFILSTALFFIFSSCSSGSSSDGQTLDLSMKTLPQTWELFKMTSNFSEATGEDMDWQEQYTLRPDRTFTKTRTTAGETQSISGTFSIVAEGDEKAFHLEYENEHPIIGSCQPLQEHLYFDKSEEILLSNWWACDGPGLFYRPVE